MSQVSFLDNQLETYIHDMQSTEEFSTLKGIRQLAEKIVEIKKNVSYPLVYSLMTLALILHFYQLQQLLLKEFFQ